ncbi:MAG: DNA cytosine methyltransferase [Terriglobia bacterium]
MEARRTKIVRKIEPGGNGAGLSKRLWKGVRGHKWRRLDPKQPSYTILAQMHRDMSEWIHPKHQRWITVREAARLQSFHDGFVFEGSECQSRTRKFEQDAKWSFCLTAGTISPRIRRDHEQTTAPEPPTGLQGEGGACRRQGRSDDSPTGRAL